MLSVIIPSLLKTQCGGQLFLDRAIASVRAQNITPVKIIVGLDAGVVPEPMHGIEFANGETKSLSSSINAAALKIEGDYVAFLEDDDWWEPSYLETAIPLLKDYGFVSSTQLEVTATGDVHRINDFATPCSWVMRRETWDAVGGFSEEYPVHQDNDWLGRLNAKKIKRAHLVESTAPVTVEAASQVRPWLAMIQKYGVTLIRHPSPKPLVYRQIHADSWMGRIGVNEKERDCSELCYRLLAKRYGQIPW